MKYILLLLLSMITFTIHGQKKFTFITQFGNQFDKHFEYFTNAGLTYVGMGIKLSKEKCDFQFGINYGISYMYPSRYVSRYRFTLFSQNIGFNFNFMFLAPEHRFRPLLKLSIFTELKDYFDNGVMNLDFYYPIYDYKFSYVTSYSYGSHGGPPYINEYQTIFYKGSPLIADISVGCAIRIAKNLNLDMSIGYGLRVINYKYLLYDDINNYSDLLNKQPTKTKCFSALSLGLSFSYYFNFKKDQ